MAEREDNVYKAKLAEQAERYDGKKYYIHFMHLAKYCSSICFAVIDLSFAMTPFCISSVSTRILVLFDQLEVY